MKTIRGKIEHETHGAVLFKRYGDKKGQWYPQSTIKRRQHTPRGGPAEMDVDDWIWSKNDAEAEPDPFFQEVMPGSQPDLPVVNQPAPPIMQPGGIALDALVRQLATTISKAPKHLVRHNSAHQMVVACLDRLNDADLTELFDETITRLHERGVDLAGKYRGECNDD